MPAPLLSEDFFRRWNEMCVSETVESATSISTSRYVPQPIENRPHYVCNRLFVGGFPPGTTSKQLTGVFSSYGTIISCNVVAQDPSKNYGFVTFQDTSSAEAVIAEALLETDAFHIGGYALKIKRAVFKPKKGTCSDEKRFRNRREIVKFYGSPTAVEMMRENINNYPPNVRTVLIPILPTSAQAGTAVPIPALPPMISTVPMPNYRQTAVGDALPSMMIPGPCCFQPSGQTYIGGLPQQWQAPNYDMNC